MAVSIISLVTALVPLILKLGMWGIETFLNSQAEKEKAKKDFLLAIQVHLNDFAKSVEGHISYEEQLEDLKKETKP